MTEKLTSEKSISGRLTPKKRAKFILPLLDEYYEGKAPVTLDYDESRPWQLLFATILSAQCTDARVNIVTKELFVKYPDLEAFMNANLSELEHDIRSIGFYHSKAANLIKCADILVTEYSGKVPEDIELLVKLPGVGRKTANVVRGNIYNIPSIVVDTHVKRVSNRLGFTDETEPFKVETDLMRVLPEDHWIRLNLQLIKLGREICRAQSPRCEECFLKEYCRYCKGHR